MDTLKQLYNLIWFCQKVSIPFEVYAFQSGLRDSWEQPQEKDLHTIHIGKDFRLIQLFSSEMNTRVLDQQMKHVWSQCWGMASHGYSHGYVTRYSLGGTPLVQAIIATRQLVANFIKREKVQKVNVVCLTDGEANPMSYILQDRTGNYRCSMLCHNTAKVHILIDPISKRQRRISPYPNQTTTEIVSFYRSITDYNWIGFRLCSKGEMQQNVIAINSDSAYVKKAMDCWNKERYVELRNGSGFDVQYMMPNKYIGEGTEELTVSQKGEIATKTELHRAFKKHMGSKMANKTFLNKFVEMIA